MQDNEKRTFLRIPTRIGGYARKLDMENEQPIFREAPLPGASGPGAFDARDASIPEGLYTLLSSLNAKLDMLLGLLGRDHLATEFPVTLDVVEISGAGLRFFASEELPLNGDLEVVLMLSQFPLRMAGAMGRIIRSEPVQNKTLYALDFTRIRERDLETIVQFVFQSQRDELREKKWS
ncbi:MAG: PilZ domain-containing protein [Thermodesulfobacteriota bacterium]